MLASLLLTITLTTQIAEKDTVIDSPKAMIGYMMFFDPRLSSNGTVSCATCHDPQHGFSRPDRVAVGINGRTGTRNSPNNSESISSILQFHDARTVGLRTQSLQPILNPLEMGNQTEDQVLRRLYNIPGYRNLFAATYGNLAFTTKFVSTGRRTSARVPQIDRKAYGNSMAAFQAMLPARDAPLDDYMRGKDTLTMSAAIGYALCQKARCFECHTYPAMTNHSYRNNGMAFATGIIGNDGVLRVRDRGRATVEGDSATTTRAFKVPTIRDVAHSAPYVHNGRFETLDRVIDHYNAGGAVVTNQGNVRDSLIDTRIIPQGWNVDQRVCVKAFLTEALTPKSPPIGTPRLP